LSPDPASFGDALDAVDKGDVQRLERILSSAPDLVHARATSVEPPYDGYFHGATLLHHVAGNPVRGELSDSIVEVAQVLLRSGADPQALCGGGPSQPETGGGTVLQLLASGRQAHVQGFTERLIDLLLEHGARLDTEGGLFAALYHTVEHRGQREVAAMLHERGVRADLPTAAGLGRLDLVRTFFDDGGSLVEGADDVWRRTVRAGATASDDEILADALLAASVNGWDEVVSFLLDRRADVNGVRPWGPFPVTPLHGAAWAGWPRVVTLLVGRGADPALREPTHGGTALDWARHAGRDEAIEAFRRLGVAG
jgi:ankyrin repeat protein